MKKLIQCSAAIPKTPNQLRAAIIEKGKEFVSKHFWNQVNTPEESQNLFAEDYWYETEFINKNNRVTALIYSLTGIGERSINPIRVGRATCAAGDVFNQHIGEAIALGRALGLDVGEFEQAEQPTVAVGQIIQSGVPVDYKVITLEDLFGNIKYQCPNGKWTDAIGGYLPEETWYTIINDTNAQYGDCG